MGSQSIAREAKAEWAIDSEAMRATGIIVLVKSNKLVKKHRDKTSFEQNAIQPPLFWFSKPALFATSEL